jgi:hypothetical protein
MAKTDYKVGDMVAYSHWIDGSMVIGIVVERLEVAAYDGPLIPSNLLSAWFPAYLIMEPGGRKSTVSHKRMELVK